ncbi:MAG: hypothetical protein KKB74_12800, partial [Bacteroidetes bacterium]|nr:hypothetical protein [Bacteroidota bacterium]
YNAGWEPLPYAYSLNNTLKIERYGQPDNLHYVVQKDNDSLQNETLIIKLDNMGIYNRSRIQITDLLSNKSYNYLIQDNAIKIETSLNYNEVAVYKLEILQ